MKKSGLTLIVAVVFTLGLSFTANAQSNKEEIDLMQALFGMDKKDMAIGFIQIDEANPFWAIYDEYETKRKELGKQRIDLIMRYSENYDNLSDAEIEAYMKEMMPLKNKTDKLIDTYYGKINKASGVKVAAQFYEFENYILSSIRVDIMNNIPFFGEFDDE